MITVRIGTERPYDVLIGPGLLPAGGEWIRRVHAPCRAAVISDSRVFPLYGDSLAKGLENAGFGVCPFVFPAGEESKNLTVFGQAEAFMAQSGLTRSDLVLTLGGGVAGDLGGFAAACYQRGIPFVQIPTSLLCAFDASVGGKTAVDLPEGKNMVGAFHQPDLVLCDTGCFATLDALRWADGAAESIKHGLIADPALFERMQTPLWKRDIDRTVEMNVLVKRSFVLGDEKDRGIRQLLNFGHTLGHAVESLSRYRLSHGQAVAVGMAAEARAARKMGFGAVHEREIIRALDFCGLPSQSPFGPEEILRVALGDKKRAGNAITVGALAGVGQGFLKKLDLEEFAEFVRLGVEA